MATMKNSVTVAGRNLLQTMAPRNAPPTEKPIKVQLWLIRIAAHMAPMVETTSVMSERYVLSSEECPEKTEERVVSLQKQHVSLQLVTAFISSSAGRTLY